MMIGMLLLWVLPIVGVVWLVKVLQENRPQSLPGSYVTPRQTLDLRYAREEISRDEYERILADLAR